jgi:signal peptidase I
MLTASFFGWRFDVVPTKSMAPAFNPGGMVVTRPAEPKDIKVGDTILFRQPHIEKEARICHRVIDIKKIDSQLFLQTKGDANEYPDPDLISSQELIGKTIFYVPRVGNVAYLSRLHETPVTLMGKKISVAFLLILAAGLIVIGTELRNMYQWIFSPDLRRRREILKKRKQRALRRKRRLFTGQL